MDGIKRIFSFCSYDSIQGKENNSRTSLYTVHIDVKNNPNSNPDVCDLGESTNASARTPTLDNNSNLSILQSGIEKTQKLIHSYDKNIKELNNEMVKLRNEMMLINRRINTVNKKLGISLAQRRVAQELFDKLNEKYRIQLK